MIDSVNIQETKRTLRAEFRKKRRLLSDAERDARSGRIVGHVQSLPEVQDAKTLHVYWPVITRGEVDTRPLIKWLIARGKNVVLPVMMESVSENVGAARLEHRPFVSEEELVINRWGISEPQAGDSVPPDQIDLVIVPALGAGRNGHRIGYGRGYYDEFLDQVSAPSVCVIYSDCLLPHLPHEPHDVPVSIIVTDQEVIRPIKA